MERSENLSVYTRGKWTLSIKKYDVDFIAILIFSDIDKTIKATIYPESKKVFYQIKGGSYGEESLEFLLENINDCKESVRQAKAVLEKDFNLSL